MTKSELYHRILLNKPPKIYIVDELMRDHVREELRLPPPLRFKPNRTYMEFNKTKIAAKNVNQ